ncbi:MAG TPA: GTP cyclohydrolase I [Anaerolineales bacterium]|nr:GTP cyclohydrolase I [Anaerolineales bacterium]
MNLHDDPDDIEYRSAVEVQARKISDEQFHKFEGYAAEIFSAYGLDLNTSATKDTPRRFIKALFDATEGYDGDPKLLRVFDTECRGEPDCRLSQVLEGPIPFFSFCEHHALPFFGKAYVGYIAHENIIGISKLTRLVRLFSKRFSVQERIGQQIADTLETMLHPHGVAVFLEAHHLCMEMRGVRETAAITRTTVWRGNYANDASLRSEFFVACGLQRADRQ